MQCRLSFVNKPIMKVICIFIPLTCSYVADLRDDVEVVPNFFSFDSNEISFLKNMLYIEHTYAQ